LAGVPVSVDAAIVSADASGAVCMARADLPRHLAELDEECTCGRSALILVDRSDRSFPGEHSTDWTNPFAAWLRCDAAE
jgi:hypothetical protein